MPSDLVWKDVLWPGTWSFPDRRRLTVGPADVRNALAQGRRMLAGGLDVPVCWEHQPDVHPRPSVELSSSVYGHPDRRAAWARNVLAPVRAFEVREVPGRGPVLYAGFPRDGLSPADLAQVRRAGKVSCRLDRDFVDARGAGTVFPGLVVSHVAITPKPVEPRQGPFLMGRGPASESYYLGAAAPTDQRKGPTVNEASLVREAVQLLARLGVDLAVPTADLLMLVRALRAAADREPAAGAGQGEQWGTLADFNGDGHPEWRPGTPVVMSGAAARPDTLAEVLRRQEELARRHSRGPSAGAGPLRLGRPASYD